MSKRPGEREISIDIFRAVTMLLMIFVNDLWSLKGIPKWLEHASAEEDYMGLADIVFPCFLVIVGMSIPYAIENRIAAGDGKMKMIWHIIIRSISLLVMGVLLVNLDNYSAAGTGLSRQWYQLLMVTGFFLVWNIYPRSKDFKRYFFVGLQMLGILILSILAFKYRGDDGAGGNTIISPQWWGILGLIGWAYGTCAILYVLFRQKPALLAGASVFFLIVNILSNAGWLSEILPAFWGPSLILGDGAFHAFTMIGIMVTLLIKITIKPQKRILLISCIGAGLILIGLYLNNYFVISKIKATPPWIFICSGIAYILYALIFFIADVKGKRHWFDPIKIAGTHTLTCYLLPYIIYSLAVLSGITLPDFLLTGVVGILKSLVFAYLIIYFTGLLSRVHIKLKI